MRHPSVDPGASVGRIVLFLSLCLVSSVPSTAMAQDSLLATEILGRPTDHSVTISAVAGFDVAAFVSFGAAPGSDVQETPLATFTSGSPIVIVLDGLQPDTRYYYRLHFRRSGTSEFVVSPDYS